MTRLRDAWEHLWFEEATPLSVAATRTIVALHSLWILLSRPDIPSLAGWPSPFLTSVPRATLVRFAIGAPASAEWTLFTILHLALVGAAAGLLSRISCLVAGLLLYHFAPFEELIVGMPHTFFGGLTLPCLALLVLSFAPTPRRGEAPSAEYRWPVALIQLLFTFNYFFAWVAKMRFAHLQWFTAANIRNWAIENWAMSSPPGALHIASSPMFCWLFAIGTFVLELSFPIVVVSKMARRIFVPMALLGHIGIIYTLNIMFPSLPLLLLYVNWDWVTLLLRRTICGQGHPEQDGVRETSKPNQEPDQAVAH